MSLMIYVPDKQYSYHKNRHITPKNILEHLEAYVNERPQGITAKDAAKVFNMITLKAGRDLGTLVRKNKIRREERTGHSHVYVYYPLEASA